MISLMNQMKFKWYPPDTGNWPGLRTKQLHLKMKSLFNYIGEKIHHIFHDTIPDLLGVATPFSEDRTICR